MGITTEQPLSTLPSRVPRPVRRPTPQTIQTLEFIHRFRHITTRHLQLALGHASPISSHKLLIRLRTLGYIDRQYSTRSRAQNQFASYFLTPLGLTVLQTQHTAKRYRQLKSITSDASLSQPAIARLHTLADAYAHFKRHHNGQFEFFTSFDLQRLDTRPAEIPDGYVRLRLPDVPAQHYFIEVFGWNRSSYLQKRRLASYLAFLENNDPFTPIGLFVITASSQAEQRVTAVLKSLLSASLVPENAVYVTTATQLDSTVNEIWRLGRQQ
jgi:hypothetical protein